MGGEQVVTIEISHSDRRDTSRILSGNPVAYIEQWLKRKGFSQNITASAAMSDIESKGSFKIGNFMVQIK